MIQLAMPPLRCLLLMTLLFLSYGFKASSTTRKRITFSVNATQYYNQKPTYTGGTAGFNTSAREVIWRSNEAGFYSHFFQMKYMYHVAQLYNRSLVVESFKCVHFPPHEGDINFCQIFELPNVRCITRGTSRVPCMASYDEVFHADHPTVCLSMKEFNNPNVVKEKVAIASSLPRLQVKSSYIKVFERLKAKAGLKSKEEYTVVHWRRGDQLATRCNTHFNGLYDQSVNCKNATALMQNIRSHQHVSGKKIFVATNEDKSTELKALTIGGMIPLPYFLKEAGNFTMLQSLIYDTLFMLDATTLLTFGISQVNDIVEQERRERGQSYCVTVEDILPESFCGRLRAKDNTPIADPVKLRIVTQGKYDHHHSKTSANHTKISIAT